MLRLRTEFIFLNLAADDLKAAKLLLHKKLYAQSVFHMEQSVEKAVKSLGIWREIITLEEARGYGHRALRCYLKIFEKTRAQISEAEMQVKKQKKSLSEYPAYTELLAKLGFAKIEVRVKWYRKSYDDLWDIALRFEDEEKRDPVKEKRAFDIASSGGKLDRYLVWRRAVKTQFYRSLRAFDRVEPKKVRDWTRITFLEFAKALKQSSKRLAAELPPEAKFVPPDIEKTRKELKHQVTTRSPVTRIMIGYLEAMMEGLIEEFFFVDSLFYLALLFYPHAVPTRYPDKGSNPLSFYNSRKPLVSRLGQFIGIAEEMLDFMDDWMR